MIDAVPTQLLDVVTSWSLGAAASNVTSSLGRAGINELQNWTASTRATNTTGVIPNLAHNESFNPANATESEHFEDGSIGDDGPIANIAVIPGLTACAANGVTVPAAPAGGGNAAGTNWIQNKFSDSLEGDECHLVVALGFGSDAAASTTNSSVSIGKAPASAKPIPLTLPTTSIRTKIIRATSACSWSAPTATIAATSPTANICPKPSC